MELSSSSAGAAGGVHEENGDDEAAAGSESDFDGDQGENEDLVSSVVSEAAGGLESYEKDGVELSSSSAGAAGGVHEENGDDVAAGSESDFDGDQGEKDD